MDRALRQVRNLGSATRRRLLAVALLAVGLTAPLTPASAGATRCWIDQGALVAPAVFGGIAGDFLIDLAAPVSEIQDSRAATAGITTTTVTDTLLVAGRRFHGVVLSVADLDARTRRFNTVINGVLGADVLNGLVVDVTPSPCRLRLTSAPGHRLKGSVRLSVRRIDGVAATQALAADGVSVRSGWFAMATADWVTPIAFAGLARPLPPDGPKPPTRLRALELGGRLFEQIPAAPTVDLPEGLDGSVGMAVLTGFHFRLDTAEGWLDLAPRHEDGPASTAGPSRRFQTQTPKGP